LVYYKKLNNIPYRKRTQKTHMYTVRVVSGTGDTVTHNNKGYELQQQMQNSQQDTNNKP